jgi:hypothetical protein
VSALAGWQRRERHCHGHPKQPYDQVARRDRRRIGTPKGFRRSYFRKISELAMYAWPTGNFEYIIVMDDSLDIVLHYLDSSGDAVGSQDVQSAAAVIVAAWERGVR